MPTRIATGLPYTELEVAVGNFDKTRAPIDRVIIHTTVGSWQGAAARFDDPTSKVSAHYGVKLDGTYIHWLEETFTAYHAGDYSMNQRSIGIEFEDGGDYNGVRPDALYKASGALVKDICTFYGIPIDRTHILKHSEVSDAPTGCPDALDIDRIVREASSTDVPMATIPQAELDQLRADRDSNYNHWQTDETVIKNLNQTINDKNNQIQTLQGEKQTLQTQLESSQEEVNHLKPIASQVPNLLAQIDQFNNIDKPGWIAREKKYLQQISDLSKTSYMTASLWEILKYKLGL